MLSAAESEVDVKAVRADIAKLLDREGYDDGSYGPLLIRLAWHAAGTFCAADGSGGSNGATIRFHPEANYGANAGLAIARNLLEPIKQKYPALSYADLYTLAGVVACEEMGGPTIPWRGGRTDAADGRKCTPDGRLPDAAQGAQHVRDIFYRMGFNDREIVALLGAHSVGRAHRDRSGFEGPWSRAPTTMSNEYFRLLLEENWIPRKWSGPAQFTNEKGGDLMMLPADMAFVRDGAFKQYVELYAKDENVWRQDFAAAFSKLLHLGCAAPAACPHLNKQCATSNGKPWWKFW